MERKTFFSFSPATLLKISRGALLTRIDGRSWKRRKVGVLGALLRAVGSFQNRIRTEVQPTWGVAFTLSPPHYSRIYSYPTRLPSKRSRISIATRMIRADRSKRFGRYNCSRYVRTYVRTRGGRHFNGIPSPSHVPLPFRKSFRATAKNNRAIYLNSGIKVAAPGFGEGRRRGGGGERNDESS